ncbi:MAG: hypothetical protein ACYDCP_05680 [Thermoplasmataceae archaeon]|jgi:hypothetical protein
MRIHTHHHHCSVSSRSLSTPRERRVLQRAIREHIVIRKIIGAFRSENESQNYQYISSLFATWNLKGKSMFVEMDKTLRKELCGFW